MNQIAFLKGFCYFCLFSIGCTVNILLAFTVLFYKREKEGKTYKNFVVKSYNKIEKKEESEEE